MIFKIAAQGPVDMDLSLERVGLSPVRSAPINNRAPNWFNMSHRLYPLSNLVLGLRCTCRDLLILPSSNSVVPVCKGSRPAQRK